MAELYLLCDDHSACLLELQEVEQVLGVDICSRKKEQMKKPVKIRSKCQIQKSTMEIVLRDCNNEEIADLGSSPSLPRQLYDLPKWLLDPWDDIKNKNSVKFALFVYKFFAYHGIALEMTEGNFAKNSTPKICSVQIIFIVLMDLVIIIYRNFIIYIRP